MGTWRPLGPVAAPRRSAFEIADNECASAMTHNTYCIHVIDAARLAFGLETVRALVYGNVCAGSETCIALEHVDDGKVAFNTCASQAFGVELHNSRRAIVRNNSFEFPSGAGCEIRVLELGEKIDRKRGRHWLRRAPFGRICDPGPPPRASHPPLPPSDSAD